MEAITYGPGIDRLKQTIQERWPGCRLDFEWTTADAQSEVIANIRMLNGDRLTGIGLFKITDASGHLVAISQNFYLLK